MKPKVLLYQPRCLFFTMPLGPLAVASAVDRGRVEPVIVDGRIEEDPVAAVEARLDGVVCFGVSVLTGAPIEDALLVSRAVKARRPELPVIWGGWHPSLFPLEVLAEAECVDVVVRGQGALSAISRFCHRAQVGQRLLAVDSASIRALGLAPDRPYRVELTLSYHRTEI